MYYRLRHWCALDLGKLEDKGVLKKIGDKDYNVPRDEPIRTFIWSPRRVAKKVLKAALDTSDPTPMKVGGYWKKNDIYVESVDKEFVASSLRLFSPKPGYLYTASQPKDCSKAPQMNYPGRPPYDWGEGVEVKTAPAVFRTLDQKNRFKISRCPYCWLTNHEHGTDGGHRISHCDDHFINDARRYKHLQSIRHQTGENYKRDDLFRVWIDGKAYSDHDGYFIMNIF